MLEILAPAGNAECAQVAINNGANAIYLGYSAFSARQNAENFDLESLSEMIKVAHLQGVFVYVAMNTIVKNAELETFMRTLLSVWNAGADAIILQDVLLGKAIKKAYPNVVLHLSTQAGVCTENGAKFAKECGFSRVILARETPLEEIAKIAKLIQTEAFVQGALCTCFSGQCYFSSFVGGNSGNRGRCKQPCRKKYSYDRKGYEEEAYALSLSDLCVGEDIQKYIDAGVVSFKIEGRMRRAEYVGSAVRYYKAILEKAQTNSALSDLKRTYNRGNYTKGLAFGQDKRFLSTAIQGHLGEKVGVVKVVNGKYFVESIFRPSTGDGFKILRDGKEVGGASFLKNDGRGFFLATKFRLKNGDGVFITTDTAVNARLMRARKTKTVGVSLFFKENERPIMECENVQIVGTNALQTAKSQPLTEDALKSCFLKTDGLPIEISFDKVVLQGDIFIPKSELNALRRALYSSLLSRNARKQEEYAPFPLLSGKGRNGKKAVIATDFSGVQTDVAILKMNDCQAPLPASFQEGAFEKYLYYPPFLTAEDEKAMANYFQDGAIDGVYAENYGAFAFAREHGIRVFAGTGLNLINAVSVENLPRNTVYYALSKEANEGEISALATENAFALIGGNIKLMDLCYCPFEKTCKTCDKKDAYTLTDENGRTFPVRRYRSANGACRFEVYNCADLSVSPLNGIGGLYDYTMKTENKKCTFGHLKRGVL